MLLVVTAILALIFLDSPWRWVAIGLALAVELFEVAFWLLWNHRRQVRVGVETMVGRRATVVNPCLPLGQVRLDGEIWSARCESGAVEGDEVVVERVDGLVLDVRPADGPESGAPTEPGVRSP